MGEQRQLHPKTLTHLVAVCSALLVAFFTWNIPDTFWLVIGMGALKILDCLSIQAGFHDHGKSLFRGLKIFEFW